MSRKSTIVIGAGVVGVCTAYYLAKRGHKVTILERNRVEEGASKGNAGIIALGHPPLGRPGLVWKTIKWMLDGGSPLYVPPRLDFALMAWMWRFRRACTPQWFETCMKLLAVHGWETGKCWDQIIDDEGIDCEYHRSGWMDVFLTKEGMDHGLYDAKLLQQHGFNVDVVGGDELRKREPAFRKEITGAAHYTDSRYANPGLFVTRLADRVKHMGVELHEKTDVASINTNGDGFRSVRTSDGREFTADCLMLAGGVWTSELARQVGARIPMQAGKGYHVNITMPSTPLNSSCVLNETFVAVTPMGGGLRLAGTVELSGINHRLMQRRVDMLSEGARKYLEGIDQTTIKTTWCGLRPCTADGLPVIDWSPKVKNVFIATGHAKYGFAYGPLAGRLASEAILDGKPSLDTSLMRADRF